MKTKVGTGAPSGTAHATFMVVRGSTSSGSTTDGRGWAAGHRRLGTAVSMWLPRGCAAGGGHGHTRAQRCGGTSCRRRREPRRVAATRAPRGRRRAHWCPAPCARAAPPPQACRATTSRPQRGACAAQGRGEARQPAPQPACTAADQERGRRGRPRSRPPRLSERDRPTFSTKHAGSRRRPSEEARRGPTPAPLANRRGGRQREHRAGAPGTRMSTGGDEQPWRPLLLALVDREARETRKKCAAFYPSSAQAPVRLLAHSIPTRETKTGSGRGGAN